MNFQHFLCTALYNQIWTFIYSCRVSMQFLCNNRVNVHFFLISMICLLEIVTFIHVPNLICKFFCLQILKQLFVVIYAMPLWLSGKALVWFSLIFLLSGRCRFESQVRTTFFVNFSAAFSSSLHVGKSYYFCKKLSVAFWRMFKSMK